jgi:hypothetical protein
MTARQKPKLSTPQTMVAFVLRDLRSEASVNKMFIAAPQIYEVSPERDLLPLRTQWPQTSPRMLARNVAAWGIHILKTKRLQEISLRAS